MPAPRAATPMLRVAQRREAGGSIHAAAAPSQHAYAYSRCNVPQRKTNANRATAQRSRGGTGAEMRSEMDGSVARQRNCARVCWQARARARARGSFFLLLRRVACMCKRAL